MARSTGIWGAEGGDSSGVSLFGGTIVATGTARTGTYHYNAKLIVPNQNAGAIVSVAPFAVSASEHFDCRARFYWRPVTLPSVNDLIVANFAGTPELRLEMNSTGHVRLGGSGAFSVSAAYTTQTVTLGNWYRVQMRIYGLRTGLAANPYRMRGTIDVHDVGTTGLATPTPFAALATDSQITVPNLGDLESVNTSCAPGFPFGAATVQAQGGGDFGFTGIAALTTSYGITVAGSVLLPTVNGPGWTVSSSTLMQKVMACSNVSAAGEDVTFWENGTLLFQGVRVALALFRPGPTFTPPTILHVGQIAAGFVSSRENDYDDIYIDLGSGASAEKVIWPTQTRVYPFVVTTQGSSDDFLPANSPANVAEIPMGAGSVTRTVAGAVTTYNHAALADATDSVRHIRTYLNGTSDGNLHAITLKTGVTFTAQNFTFNAFTGSADSATNYLDTHYDTPSPLDSTAFAALEFGGICVTTASPFTIKNLYMEVLGGPAAGGGIGATNSGPVIGSWLGAVFTE